jgi:hypothetical protein
VDLTSTVRTDTLPAVASVLVPGSIGAAPFAALCLAKCPPLRAFASAHEATTLIAAVLIAVGTGFLIESLGSYVEYYIIDSRHRDRNQMMEKWRLYLRIAWINEPTGQHYLRRMLAVFKFELNMFMAVLFVLIGVIPLTCTAVITTETALWITLFAVVLGGYLFHAATQTSKVLAEIRELLLLGVGQPPFDTSAQSQP